jgi:hypothetical protein
MSVTRRLGEDENAMLRGGCRAHGERRRDQNDDERRRDLNDDEKGKLARAVSLVRSG